MNSKSDSVLFESDTLIESNNSSNAKYESRQSKLRYARPFDYFLLITSVLFAAIYGLMPSLNVLVLRGLITTLTTAEAQYNTDGKINIEWFTEELLVYVRYYVIVFVLTITLGYISIYSIFSFCERQIFAIRTNLFKSLLDRDIEFFEQNEIGQLTQKISSGIEKIRDGTTDKLVMVISSVVSLISGILVAFYMSPEMSGVLICIVPFIMANLIGSALLVKSPIKNESDTYGKARSFVENVITQIRTVLAFCGQFVEINRYDKILAIANKYGLKKVFISSFFIGTYQFVMFGSMSVAFWYSTNLFIEGKVQSGDVIMGIWAALGGAIRCGQSLPFIDLIMSAKISVEELFELIDQKSQNNKSKQKGKIMERIDGNVEFQSISFSYPTRPQTKALNQLSFKAEAGEIVNLVGRSGSGKTTIANLLMKHYESSFGTIKIDNIPLNQLDTEFVRQFIGIIPQQPVIFSLTVEENLKLGRDVNEQEMIKACKMANAHDFIEKLPKGYKTPIMNGKLSGGEAQRLTIARALITNPKILIFDEASSALDVENERLIQSAIEKISIGRLIIQITHRLPVKNADQILVLECGNLIEKGNHEELILKNGLYHQLVNCQIEEKTMEDSAFNDDISRYQSESQSCMQSVLSGLDDLNSDEDFERKDKKYASLVRILKFARPEYIFIFPGLLATLLRGCTWPIFSIIYGRLFKLLSAIIATKSGEVPIQNFIEFFLLGAGSGVVTFFSGYMLGISGEKLTRRMRRQLFENILSQDGEFFDKHPTTELVTRLSNDPSSVSAAIDQRLAECLQGATALVVGIGVAFIFDYKMAFFGIFTPLITVAIQIVLMNALKNQIRKDSELAKETSRIAFDTLSQIRTVHFTNAKHFFYNLYRKSAEQLYLKSRRRAYLQAASYGLLGSYFSLTFSTAYLIALILIRNGHSTVFSAFQAIESIGMGTFSVMLVATFISDYLRARFAANQIFKMMDEEPKINSCSNQGLKPLINGNVCLNDVYFAYPGSQYLVLKNIKLDVKSGQNLALVGPSGGGKTSIASLIERFYDVVHGSIQIDGVDIRQININHLRSNIAYVQQQPALFDFLTLAENIAYGKPNASREEIENAAIRVNIHDSIIALPNGYDTVVGKEGFLSGGQIQRVALARVLLKPSKIIILDEVNSALDPENEKIIQETLKLEAKKKTFIVISHRLRTIKNSNLIAVISAGQIQEIGSHDELIRKEDGIYHKLTSMINENVD